MEAMRQRLLAQQLGMGSPSTPKKSEDRKNSSKDPGVPSTPDASRSRPTIQPWRSEPRVKMMPLQPSTPGQSPVRRDAPWAESVSTPTRVALQRRGFNTPTPKPPATPDRPSSYYVSTPGSATPLETPHVSAAERERQLRGMIAGIVSVTKDVDMSKARVPGMQCLLLPHQVQGVEWMKKREHGKVRGGILADDMGLGKTVQMLALMMQHRTLEDFVPDVALQEDEEELSELVAQHQKSVWESETSTTLIVAPVAVIEQWQREANEKTGRKLKIYVHHGPQRTKTADTFRKADVVITSYATAANEHENFLKASTPPQASTRRQKRQGPTPLGDSDDSDVEVALPSEPVAARAAKNGPGSRYPLFEMKWLRVVLDEAQNIKNHRAKSSLACFQLSLQAASRWCISGTPLQNNALEIFSLLHFLRVAPFDDLRHFQDTIMEPLRSNKQARVEVGIQRLGVVLQSVMLRRTKDAEYQGKKLLDLPPRNVEIVSQEFQSTRERDFYRELESRIQAHVRADKSDNMNYMGALLMLLRLRQACNHPALVTGSSVIAAQDEPTPTQSAPVSIGDEDDELAAMLAGLSVKTRHCDRCQVALPATNTESPVSPLCDGCAQQAAREAARNIAWDRPGQVSTKVDMILSLLDRFSKTSGDDKTIIFSQFTSFLNLLEPALKNKGHEFVRYDGAMRRPAREAALQTIRTKSNVKVILISFKAGSTGLNLTCCNRVILCDLWWNPQIEEQAFDRAHRYVLILHQSGSK